jgi:D-glycero-D-manno-heptose 1,7-bisphosphate phosphatase
LPTLAPVSSIRDDVVIFRPAVFLDRDGVLNTAIIREGRPHPPASAEELVIAPGVPEACRRLRSLGFLLVVVTNQPDVARGTIDAADVTDIHTRLREQVPLDSIWVCPHDDRDRCSCRKPAPGLLHKAAAFHHIDLTRSFMVGDRWRDIEAGRAAGCRTVLVVDRIYREKPAEGADAVVNGLPEAAAWIATVGSSHDKELHIG